MFHTTPVKRQWLGCTELHQEIWNLHIYPLLNPVIHQSIHHSINPPIHPSITKHTHFSGYFSTVAYSPSKDENYNACVKNGLLFNKQLLHQTVRLLPEQSLGRRVDHGKGQFQAKVVPLHAALRSSCRPKSVTQSYPAVMLNTSKNHTDYESIDYEIITYVTMFEDRKINAYGSILSPWDLRIN